MFGGRVVETQRKVPLEITVVSARVVGTEVKATVRADHLPGAQIVLQLRFPITAAIDIWSAARDEALCYLDVT